MDEGCDAPAEDDVLASDVLPMAGEQGIGRGQTRRRKIIVAKLGL